MKNRSFVYFYLGVYISFNAMVLSVAIAVWLRGDGAAACADSWVDVLRVFLWALISSTIPILSAIVIISATIPKRLRDRFYALYWGQNGRLFFCGFTIAVVMSVACLGMLALSSVLAGPYDSILKYTVLVFACCVSPLMVKLFVLFKTRKEIGEEQ